MASQALIRKLVTALVVLTPLALLPGIFLSHDVMPKVILLLLGAATLLFLLPRWSNSLTALGQSPAGRCFLVLVTVESASLLLSTLASTQRPLSFAGVVWRRFGSLEQFAVLVIAVAAACVIRNLPSFFRALSIGGGLAALYGVLQYFSLDPFLPEALYKLDYLGGITRPPGTLGNAIYFAAYLAPIVLLALDAGTKEQSLLWRFIHFAAALLGSMAIVLSGTRASLVAVFAGAAWLAWRGRSAKTFAAAAGALLLIMAAIAMSLAGKDLRHRIVQAREDPGGPRLGVWRESPAIVRHYPLFGSGPDTFAVEFRRIESRQLSRAYPDFYHETPHNAFLDAATAQGIPGLLILIAAFAAAWFYGSKHPGLQSALLGMLIGCIFASFTLITWMYLWIVIALLMTASLAVPDAKPLPALWKLPATATGAVFIAVAFFLGMQDTGYAQLKDAVDKKDEAAAHDAYDSALAFSMGMPGYELWSSREMATLKDWKTAQAASTLAETRGEERFSALYQSAVLDVATNNFPAAIAKAREAIALAPNWYKPHLLLAQLLDALGQKEEATKEAATATDLGWKH